MKTVGDDGRSAVGASGLAASALSSALSPSISVPEFERKALLDKLEQARSSRATLLHAPAGYGKTSLLAQWRRRLEESGARPVWLSLSEQHRTPSSLAASLAAAAAQAGVIPAALSPAPSAAADAPTTLAQQFCDTLDTSAADVVFIFDNYTRARSEGVDALLDGLLRRAPPGVHFAVAARGQPGFLAQSLRMAGQLVELGSDQLSFTPGEMRALFGDALDDDELALLAEKTGGWPAGVRMIDLARRRGQDIETLLQEFSGANHQVGAYLTERVMRDLTASEVDFLVRTSLLSQVGGDVADFVLERDDSWAVLARLDAEGAFLIPLDAEHQWYRYQKLFAAFLQSALRRLGGAEIRRLHTRASVWHEKHGRIVDAASHALAVGDFDRVEALVTDADDERFWVVDRLSDYIGLVRGLPEDRVARLPRLRAIKVVHLAKRGKFAEAKALLESTFQPSGPDAPSFLVLDALLKVYTDAVVDRDYIARLEEASNAASGRAIGRAMMNDLLALFYWRHGEADKAIRAATLAVKRYIAAHSRYGVMTMQMHRGMFDIAAARLHDAFARFTRAREVIRLFDSGNRDLAAVMALCTSEALYNRGDLAAAKAGLARALEHAATYDSWFEVLVAGYRTASALAFAEKGLQGAFEVLDAADRTAERRGFPRLAEWVRLRRAYLAAVAGDVAAACRLADVARSNERRKGAPREHGPAFGWREQLQHRLTLARLTLAERRADAALAELASIESDAQATGFHWLALKAAFLQAMALASKDRMDEASPIAERVLAWTRAERMPALILEEGFPAVRLLEDIARHAGFEAMAADAFDWIAELIARSADYRPGPAAEPFSRREQDVLDALRRGLPNKQIADVLGVSHSAVSFHLKNVFRKAGVRSRHLVVPVTDKRRQLASATTASYDCWAMIDAAT